MVPFIIFFPRNLIYLRKIVSVILILSVFFVLFDVRFLKDLIIGNDEQSQYYLEYFAKYLAIPCGFLLLLFSYHFARNRGRLIGQRVWVLFVILLTLFLAVIRARRGLIFMSVNILLAGYLIHGFLRGRKSEILGCLPIIVVSGVLLFMATYSSLGDSDLLEFLNERLKEDTRSDVEQFFYLDMSDFDWIVGRGINGSYYCPTGATEDGYRDVIETDYLQLVLKGGLVNVFLLLLIAVPAVILGLFYSKNLLSKAAGIWILLWILALYPQSVTAFSMNYLLVWVSIGICYSRDIRNAQEAYLRKCFEM
jgi:hypothetical protein